MKNFVVIPTGVAVPTGHHATEDERRLAENATLTRWKQKADEADIGLFTPTGGVFHSKFATVCDTNIPYSPADRAKMLFDAITATKKDGTYQFDCIYITGGFSTHNVIAELEKLGELPKRNDNLKIYGFSDASQLHHYLGQRGIATPVYYSGNVGNLLHILKEDKKPSEQEKSFLLQAQNETAQQIDTLSGYTQPGSQASVEKKKSHQTALFKKENNMLIVEFRGADENDLQEMDAFIDVIKRFQHRDFSIILSQDTPGSFEEKDSAVYKLLEKLKEAKISVPVFKGAPVGHNMCLKEGYGKPISLFTKTEIQKEGGQFFMRPKSDWAAPELRDERASDLIEQEGRDIVTQKEDGIHQELNLDREIGSAGLIIREKGQILKGADSYTIHINLKDKDNHPVDPIQPMGEAFEELLYAGILNSNLKKLNFKSDASIQDEKGGSRYLFDIMERNGFGNVAIAYNGKNLEKAPKDTSLSFSFQQLNNHKGLLEILKSGTQEGQKPVKSENVSLISSLKQPRDY